MSDPVDSTPTSRPPSPAFSDTSSDSSPIVIIFPDSPPFSPSPVTPPLPSPSPEHPLVDPFIYPIPSPSYHSSLESTIVRMRRRMWRPLDFLLNGNPPPPPNLQFTVPQYASQGNAAHPDPDYSFGGDWYDPDEEVPVTSNMQHIFHVPYYVWPAAPPPPPPPPLYPPPPPFGVSPEHRNAAGNIRSHTAAAEPSDDLYFCGFDGEWYAPEEQELPFTTQNLIPPYMWPAAPPWPPVIYPPLPPSVIYPPPPPPVIYPPPPPFGVYPEWRSAVGPIRSHTVARAAAGPSTGSDHYYTPGSGMAAASSAEQRPVPAPSWLRRPYAPTTRPHGHERRRATF